MKCYKIEMSISIDMLSGEFPGIAALETWFYQAIDKRMLGLNVHKLRVKEEQDLSSIKFEVE